MIANTNLKPLRGHPRSGHGNRLESFSCVLFGHFWIDLFGLIGLSLGGIVFGTDVGVRTRKTISERCCCICICLVIVRIVSNILIGIVGGLHIVTMIYPLV